ncbi:MAG TPA: nuclear transport factor 2 family protein [Edaphobacter sp.]|jgi:ketosteroid isomerase-like protein|nr:nuclear transport factor 2 family protein [Edaphobacter sp.]
MKTHKFLGLGLALLLAGPALIAQQQTTEAVIQAELIGCKAYATNSAEGVNLFLADDYTLTDSKGVVTTKQDDLDDFLKSRVHYTTFQNKNMKVRLYPGVAIVTGQTVVKGSAAGKPFDVEVQFTDTLVYLHGHWKLAAGHVSRLRNS